MALLFPTISRRLLWRMMSFHFYKGSYLAYAFQYSRASIVLLELVFVGGVKRAVVVGPRLSLLILSFAFCRFEESVRQVIFLYFFPWFLFLRPERGPNKSKGGVISPSLEPLLDPFLLLF